MQMMNTEHLGKVPDGEKFETIALSSFATKVTKLI